MENKLRKVHFISPPEMAAKHGRRLNSIFQLNYTALNYIVIITGREEYYGRKIKPDWRGGGGMSGKMSKFIEIY